MGVLRFGMDAKKKDVRPENRWIYLGLVFFKVYNIYFKTLGVHTLKVFSNYLTPLLLFKLTVPSSVPHNYYRGTSLAVSLQVCEYCLLQILHYKGIVPLHGSVIA